MQASGHPWEESRGMGFSYGYNRMESLKDYRTNRQLVLMLIDIVSRGGNLLLDIGPTADGRIPVVMEERLTEIGNWLRPNAEAIYGTRAWQRTRQWSGGTVPKMEEKEFRAEYDITQLVDTPPAGYARVEAFFTTKGDAVYAILPRWPDGTFTLDGIGSSSSTQITLLETGNPVTWRADGNRLQISASDALRSKAPPRHAYVLKLVNVTAA
jgi:alpha-L-fucosidase